MTKQEIFELIKIHVHDLNHSKRELEIRKKQVKELQIQILEEQGKIYELLQQIEKLQKEGE